MWAGRCSVPAVFLGLSLLCFGSPTGAQERATLRASTPNPGSGHDIRLDGRLEEAAWAAADSISDLITIEPEEGGVPAGRTVVRVLASPDEILIGVRCWDPQPSGIVSFSMARDTELDDEDHVLLVLDTFGDNRSGYVFGVNPSGCRFDGLVTSQGDDVNSNWDAIWEAATTSDASGWAAEIRLPIKSLSFKKGLSEWGFNVQRRVQRLQETSRWSGATRDFEIYQTSRAGLLTGLPVFRLGLGLTVRPGLFGDANRPEPGISRHTQGEVSLDATQKLGPNLSATLTVNTDFGETEADVRQTNLTRFDILFPERRTFFLEGADIFEFGLGLDVDDANILPFFSRRIGLSFPEGEGEGEAVPVVVGGKLQGRVGETNLGGLVVATDRVDRLGVPKTTMGAVRARQNVLSESSVGMIATFGDPMDRRRSWLGGADFTYRTSEFQEDKNFLAGVWGLKTDREGLLGDRYAFGGKVAYPNDPLELALTYLRIGDGFQPSLGFVQRLGHVVFAKGEYILYQPSWVPVRQQSYVASHFVVLDRHGVWESHASSVRPFDWLLESGDRFQATIERQGERPLEEFDVFDSPTQTVEIPAGTYEWTRYRLATTFAEKRRASGEISWSFGDFYQGDLHTVEADIAFKPSSLLTLRLSGERNEAKLPQGNFTQYLYGGRVELKVSPDFQITNFVQYDNESRSLGSATRLRWTFDPLGDLFVAFNHNQVRSLPGAAKRWEFESDQALVKIQYAVRL